MIDKHNKTETTYFFKQKRGSLETARAQYTTKIKFFKRTPAPVQLSYIRKRYPSRKSATDEPK